MERFPVDLKCYYFSKMKKCSRGDCTSKPKTKIYESEIFSTKHKSSILSGMII
jgi:hypothetical protein